MNSDTNTVNDRNTISGNVELHSISTINNPSTNSEGMKQKDMYEGNGKYASELSEICVKIHNLEEEDTEYFETLQGFLNQIEVRCLN